MGDEGHNRAVGQLSHSHESGAIGTLMVGFGLETI